MEEDLRDQVRDLQTKLQDVENRADEFERENKKLLRQIDQLEGRTTFIFTIQSPELYIVAIYTFCCMGFSWTECMYYSMHTHVDSIRCLFTIIVAIMQGLIGVDDESHVGVGGGSGKEMGSYM